LSLTDAVPVPVSLPDPGLARCLAVVPDPRDPRGVRHSLASLLMASMAAVLAGARSFTAIGEWVADAPPQLMAAIGITAPRAFSSHIYFRQISGTFRQAASTQVLPDRSCSLKIVGDRHRTVKGGENGYE
jgi:hypothetical protein